MLDGAPGPGREDDDGGAGPSGAAALRDRGALRAASRQDARESAPPWQPSVLERLREARWSLTSSAAAGALLVLAAVAVLLVLSAGAGRSAVPTPTPGVAVPARTPQAASAGSSDPGSAASSSGPAALPGAADPAALAAGGAQPTEVVVDVTGQVEAPGLVRLPTGARVDDAVRAAGGALAGADLRRVNLARVLLDGEQVVVPAPGEELPAPPAGGPATAGGPSRTGASGGGAGGGSGGAATAAPAALDLNRATLADLDALPGVGPVLAQRLLDWRAEHGRFTSAEEIGEVPGFGPAALERLTPLLAVDP